MIHENLPSLIFDIKSRYESISSTLKIDEKEAVQKNLENNMGEMNFWENKDKAQEVIALLKTIKFRTVPAQSIKTKIEEIEILLEMEEELEVSNLITIVNKELDSLEVSALLGGKYDQNNCYITLQAGAGGQEAEDYCQMLHRMYIYYCEGMGWELETLDMDTTSAGINYVTLRVSGFMAYGYLSAERGTHRLARVSPFNAEGKRQMSFVTIDVTPEFPEIEDDLIQTQYLSMEAFVRASGPGGQNVNKVATAVRLSYKTPKMAEAIMIVCSVHKSLEQNKKQATSLLLAKLEQIEEDRRQAEKDNAAGGVLTKGWGSQIRSYVLYDNRVKDHRTNYEESNPKEVLNGRIGGFIDAELRRRAKEKN